MKTVLSIAGSDCSGGAGIQADIKTITAHQMYAMSVITALTAQNTMGVQSVLEVSPAFVGQQLESVFSDIRPNSTKIGMLANESIVRTVADKLKQYKAENVILDPVMISTSGKNLLSEQAKAAMIQDLFPVCRVITPNIPEAEELSGISISNQADMVCAAKKIAIHFQGTLLIKGGHLHGDAADLVFQNNEAHWLVTKRIQNKNTHGTGCTLSSAIACNLAAGESTIQSVDHAKRYLTGAIGAMLDLGRGSGPLNHMYQR